MSEIFETPNVIVVKVGSSTLVDDSGRPDRAFIGSLCEQAANLTSKGYRVVVVSSGAVAAGMERLGLDSRPSDMPGRQACASAGQAALTEVYAEQLARRGVPCGQVLLTRRDLTDREGYLNARNTLGKLLALGAVPVVNENDTVSTTEFTFGDNDMLGAIVATMLNAERVRDPLGRRRPLHREPVDGPGGPADRPRERDNAADIRHGGRSGLFRGHGRHGLQDPRRARDARGRHPDGGVSRTRGAVARARRRGEGLGTRFEAPRDAQHENARKLWIGLAEMPRGTVTVDEGASRAVREGGASSSPWA